jgi:predicted nucleic acid-binding protein
MKVILDASVLVAAIAEAHPMHERAFPWLQRAKHKEFSGYVAAHSLAELYAVLTRLPLRPPISPALAWQLIRENVLASLDIVSLQQDDYRAVIESLASLGISGGTVYDALIVQAAVRIDADHVVTLNGDHFRRVKPDFANRIVVP